MNEDVPGRYRLNLKGYDMMSKVSLNQFSPMCWEGTFGIQQGGRVNTPDAALMAVEDGFIPSNEADRRMGLSDGVCLFSIRGLSR